MGTIAHQKKGIAAITMFIVLALIVGLVIILVIVKPVPGLLGILFSSLPIQGSQDEQNMVSYIKEVILNDPSQAITLCTSFLQEYPKSKLASEVSYLKLYATIHADLLNSGSSSSLVSSYLLDMVTIEDSRKLLESFASSASSDDDSYRTSAQFYVGLLEIRSVQSETQKMKDFLISDIPSDAIFLTPDFASTLKSAVMPYDLVLPAESFEYAGAVILVDLQHCETVADIYLDLERLDRFSSFDSSYFDAMYTYIFTHCEIASSRYISMIDEYKQDSSKGGQGITRLRQALYKSSYKEKIKALDIPYINNPLTAITD